MKRSRINAVSSKRRKRLASYAESRDVVARRSAGRCEARVEGVCTGRHEHTHHKRRRSQGGSDEPSNLIAACGACHAEIHANPAWAMENGLLKGAGDAA